MFTTDRSARDRGHIYCSGPPVEPRRRSRSMSVQLKAGRRWLAGFASVALLGSAAQAHAATWYASASNSSTPPVGTLCTQAAPCTLAYALGTKLAAGDTLILFSGTYTDTPDLNTSAK